MTPTHILAYGAELFVSDLPAQHWQDDACTLHPTRLSTFQFVRPVLGAISRSCENTSAAPGNCTSHQLQRIADWTMGRYPT